MRFRLLVALSAFFALAVVAQNVTTPLPPSTAAPMPSATTCCAGAPAYVAWDNGGSGSIALNNNEGSIQNNSIATIAAWVNMQPEQQGISYIISKTAPAWQSETASYGLYWDHTFARLQITLTTNNGTSIPLNAAGTSRGNVFLPNGNWRLVTLEINSLLGTVDARVDLVPEVSLTFSPLMGGSVVNSAPVSIGCQYFFQNCINGLIGDVFYFNRSVTNDELATLFQYRQCPSKYYNPQPNPSLTCAPPLPGANIYTRDPNDIFREVGPAGTSPSQFVMVATTNPPFQWFQSTQTPTLGNVSWTPAQQTALSCGASQKFTLNLPALPSGAGGWTAQLMQSINFTPTAADSFTVTVPGITAPISFAYQPSGAVYTFLVPAQFSGPVLQLVVTPSNNQQSCVASVQLTPLGAVSLEITNTAGVNYAWVGSDANGLILAQGAANANTFGVGLAPYNATSCAGVAPNVPVQRPPNSPWTFTIPTTFTPGTFNLCFFPTGDANQGYLLASAPAFTNGQLIAVPLPAGGAPLQNSWLLNMLHLGATYGSHISHGYIWKDYFSALPGGEAYIQPKIYDQFSGNTSSNLTWTPMSVTDGNWGVSTSNEWVQYTALAVYVPNTQLVTLSVRHYKGAKVWVDGDVVLSNDADDGGLIDITNPVTLTTGWHQLIFKFARSVSKSYFYARIDRGVGMSWAFELPGAQGANGVPYSDTCAAVNASNAPVCAPGANMDEEECYNIGCCWMNATNTCLAPPGDQLKYRSDGRCGPGFPAPGAEIGQCNANSINHVSCCSPFGWCGNSTAHCTCQGCTNYRYLGAPRCRYQPLNSAAGFTCGNSPTIFIGNTTLVGCQERCDFNPQCQGYTYSNFGQCSHWFQKCVFAKADNTIATARQRYCNCSFRDDCPGQNCVCSQTGAYTTLPGVYPEDVCQYQCANSFFCMGFNWINGSCNMWSSPCPATAHLVTTPYPAQYDIYTCPGLSDPVPIQPSNASFIATSRSTVIGCFEDAPGSIMFDDISTYPNLYTGNQPMSPQVCETYCISVGALFFALHGGSTCMCGMRQPNHDYVRVSFDGRCKLHCPGNASAACGGTDASLMYAITPSSVGCPTGSYLFRNTCYFLQRKLLTYAAATASCLAMGGQLASSPDYSTAQFVLGLPHALNVSDSFTTYFTWIGGAADNTLTRFEWVDGSDWTVSSWRWDEPNGFVGELCLEGFSNYPTPWIWKGTWNNRNCSAQSISVCAIPVPPFGSFMGPAIATASNAGNLACSTSAPPQYTSSLIAFWTLSNGLASSIPGVPAAVFYPNVSSPLGSQPNFVNLTRMGGALLLSNGAYLNASSNINRPTDTLSICVTFAQQVPGDASIIAKLMDPAVQFSFDSTPSYQYAMRIQGGRICYYSMYDFLCSTLQVTMGASYTVCGVSSAVRMALYINGVRDSINVLNGYTTYSTSSTPLIIGGETLRKDTTKVSAQFSGFISNVQIFNAQIQDSLAFGTYYCLQTNPVTTLPVYMGANTVLTLNGLGLFTIPSALVAATCAGQSSTSVSSGNVATFISSGTESAQLMIPAKAVSVFSIAGLTICLPSLSAVNAGVYPVATGINLNLVQVTGFLGIRGQQLNVTYSEDSTSPTIITVTGINFDMSGQGIALTADPQCQVTMMTAAPFITTTLTTAVFVFAGLRAPLAVFYVCWTPFTSVGVATPLYPTGLSVGVSYGSEVVTLAVSDGSASFAPAMYDSGATVDAANYIKPCTSTKNFFGAVVLQVAMGQYSDFYTIPTTNTVCDFLAGRNRNALYSPIDPTSSAFQGIYYTVPPSSQMGWLGGSDAGYPTDGRQYLNFWGSNDVNNQGGCCQSDATQTLGWGRAFQIVAKSVPKTSVFLQLPNLPTGAYVGASITVFANVVDAYGNYVVNKTYMTMFTIACDAASTQTTSGNGGVAFQVNPRLTAIGAVMSCNVTAQLYSSSVSKSFQVVIEPFPAADTIPLDPSTPVQNVLQLGQPPQGLIPMVLGGGLDEDLLASSGGEANQMPQPGQLTKSSDNASTTLSWTGQSVGNGQFGTFLGIKGLVGYFAFAIYSPVDQVVTTTLSVNISGIVYVAGVQRLVVRNQGTQTSGPFLVSSGWSQVVVKLVTAHWGSSTPYFSIIMGGASMLYRLSMPSSVPEGATPLDSQAYITSMLHLGNPLASVPGSMSSDPVPIDAMPGDGDTANGFTWSQENSFTGSWQVPAQTLGAPLPTISYYSFALYSTLGWSYSFTVSLSGPLEILVDGVFSLDQGAYVGNGTTQSLSIYLSQGWHQVLVKAGLTLQPSSFSIQCNDIGLATSTQIPLPAPIGGSPLNAGPITNMLQLEGPMNIQSGEFTTIPARVLVNQTVPANSIPLNVVPRVNQAQQVVVPGFSSVQVAGWTWQARVTRGNWGGDFGTGGSWESYFAMQLYSPQPQTVVPKLSHSSYGAQLYLDGSLVTSVYGQQTDMIADSFSVAAGWHTLLARMEMPSTFRQHVEPNVTQASARARCTALHGNRFELCKLQAYCPFGAPRVDGLTAPPTGASATNVQWAPFTQNVGSSPAWVQISGPNVCSTFQSLAPPPTGGHTQFGCCGGFDSPTMNVELFGQALYSAYERPLTPLPPPMISVANALSATPQVVITDTNSSLLIKYTTDGFTAPGFSAGNTYTGPFTVSKVTTVMAAAVTRDGLRTSSVVTFTVVPPSKVTPNRLTFVAGAISPVLLAGSVSGDLFFFINNMDPRIKYVSGSVGYARRILPDANYSGLISAGSNGYINFPSNLIAGQYVAYHFTLAAQSAGQGAAVLAATFSVANTVIGPMSVQTGISVNFLITGGVMTGDAVVLASAATPLTPFQCYSRCSAIAVVVPQANVINNAFTSDVFSTGVITCACYLALAAAPSGFSGPWSPIVTNVSVWQGSVTPPGTTDQVTRISAVQPVSTGTSLQVFGTFTLPFSSYSFFFVGTNNGSFAGWVNPSCAVTSGTSQYLLCRATVPTGTSGAWSFQVKTPSSTLPMSTVASSTMIVLAPPAPTISSITGSCATDAIDCVTGATLTIQGSGFDYVVPGNNMVSLGSLRGAITGTVCTVTLAHESQLTCLLSVPGTVDANSQYEISVQLQFSSQYKPLTSGVYGTLTVKGTSDDRGITGSATNDSPATNGDNNNILIAVLIAVAVLLVAAIGVIAYLRRRSKQVYRTGEAEINGNEDDYLPMSAAAAK